MNCNYYSLSADHTLRQVTDIHKFFARKDNHRLRGKRHESVTNFRIVLGEHADFSLRLGRQRERVRSLSPDQTALDLFTTLLAGLRSNVTRV